MATIDENLLLRVADASLHSVGGPVRVVISGLPAPEALIDALASAGARGRAVAGRVHVMTTPSRLVDATGRALGRADAERLEVALEQAIDAWLGPPPDLDLPGGGLATSVRTAVMGVVNVTPDSFYDGGEWFESAAAIEHGRHLHSAGADLVDVGGESTRPGAAPVEEDEELARVVPVVEALVAEGITVSVDTRKATVAREAVAVGARICNDVSGGEADPQMLETVAELGVGFVLMHMRGTPETMQDDPRYEDVVATVHDHLAAGVRRCASAGIDPQRIAVDPGIGFGKTVAHNLTLLRRLRELRSIGRPVLVGASRKSFIGRTSGAEDPSGRLAGSLAAAAAAVLAGAAIVRVHDVAETVQAVRVARAIADAETG